MMEWSRVDIMLGKKPEVEYLVDVQLLCAEGTALACSATSVMVLRTDLRHFRIIALRPGEAIALSKKSTSAGRIQLIGLDEARQTLGPRWDGFKGRAMATEQHVIQAYIRDRGDRQPRRCRTNWATRTPAACN